MDKHTIRQQVRAVINNIPNEQYQERSFMMRKQLLKEPSIIEGKTIAVTISAFPEVDTIAIVEELWRLGKTVAVPKCHPKTREMSFYAIGNFNQLETVYMDLKEPITEKTKLIAKEDIDTIIVPGIVFDEKGYRIGYGGGYYDRYLQGYNGKLIAIAFKEQLVNHVPTETHDLPVHTIITETGRINCVANRKE
ncbi:5-formyltetrahydrofolate cyclo-ligase [Solibacillus sp. CAU 1738]|uniref:5-formyltetrahydrofolate cyclo-ligase n=1 Tax=Solibacillus sp. CAU 1738 TaxID=3140363 RepID=UPI00326111CD